MRFLPHQRPLEVPLHQLAGGDLRSTATTSQAKRGYLRVQLVQLPAVARDELVEVH